MNFPDRGRCSSRAPPGWVPILEGLGSAVRLRQSRQFPSDTQICAGNASANGASACFGACSDISLVIN